MFRYLRLNLLIIALTALAAPGWSSVTAGLTWNEWSDDLFRRAAREQKFILLDLEAVWCHWCHVMDQKTYSDPQVQELIKTHFIAVKVDQDSRPDLSQRYRDYGWPATVIFSPQGGELLKQAGYIPADEMAQILKTIVEDPKSAEKKLSVARRPAATQGALSDSLRKQMEKKYQASWDPEQGGLNLVQKFLDEDSLEYAMLRAGQGSSLDTVRARNYLDQNLALLDPAWGGFYQYSTHGDWRHPHFEKIMSFQIKNLRSYALAYLQWGDAKYLQTAQEVRRYLNNFLKSPAGAFYTSQDADLIPGQHSEAYFSQNDAERRQQGVPRVDTHRYSRENGWAIEALALLYAATGNEEILGEAKRAANWILANRSLAGSPFETTRYLAAFGRSPVGGFRHDVQDPAGPYLGDTLAMGRAFLSLYSVTGERSWLSHARRTGNFIVENFSAEAGLITAVERGGLPPVVDTDENLAAARFFNLLSHYSGDAGFKEAARRAMRYLAAEEIALERISDPGILLADLELSRDPLHITIVGPKGDPHALSLFQAALRSPTHYKRVEWWDRSEGPMPNPDVQYPEMRQSAAFVCSNKLCSSPVYQADKIAPLVARFSVRSD